MDTHLLIIITHFVDASNVVPRGSEKGEPGLPGLPGLQGPPGPAGVCDCPPPKGGCGSAVCPFLESVYLLQVPLSDI